MTDAEAVAILEALPESKRRELMSAYMRGLQAKSAKARWAKFTPEARSQAMQRLARQRHQSTKMAQRAGKVPLTLLQAFRRDSEPVWKPEQLMRLRRELRVSQDQIAPVLGQRRETVKRWETGQHVPSRAAQRLIWLLTRSLQGRPVDFAALLTAGRSDAYRTKQAPGPVQPETVTPPVSK